MLNLVSLAVMALVANSCGHLSHSYVISAALFLANEQDWLLSPHSVYGGP